MKPLGRTVRLYLVDGSPLGLIVAEIIGWTGKILTFPRGLLPDALKRPEVAKTGVYFLVGPHPENPSRSVVYIGESDDVARRLKQHDGSEDKDFFEQVALLVSKDENLTKSHVRYLESRLIELIRSNGSASLRNGNQGSPVTLPESEQADMEYALQQLRVLMPTLGFTFLQATPTLSAPSSAPSNDTPSQDLDSPLFELSGEGGNLLAQAREQEGQFIVLPGASLRWEKNAPKSVGGYDFNEEKQALFESGKLVPTSNGFYRLETEMSFKSPSAASCFIRHRPQYNGRTDWKVKDTGQAYGAWRKAQIENIV